MKLVAVLVRGGGLIAGCGGTHTEVRESSTTSSSAAPTTSTTVLSEMCALSAQRDRLFEELGALQKAITEAVMDDATPQIRILDLNEARHNVDDRLVEVTQKIRALAPDGTKATCP
jgi:hypothetical protein